MAEVSIGIEGPGGGVRYHRVALGAGVLFGAFFIPVVVWVVGMGLEKLGVRTSSVGVYFLVGLLPEILSAALVLPAVLLFASVGRLGGLGRAMGWICFIVAALIVLIRIGTSVITVAVYNSSGAGASASTTVVVMGLAACRLLQLGLIGAAAVFVLRVGLRSRLGLYGVLAACALGVCAVPAGLLFVLQFGRVLVLVRMMPGSWYQDVLRFYSPVYHVHLGMEMFTWGVVGVFALVLARTERRELGAFPVG